ncbi:MAG TPA: hypothetical protein VHE13_15845 [Opitutus sp.]|nr:hypothetical protein [Opitutus sp.]
MKPHVFQRHADDDYCKALRHYGGISPTLGQCFYFEVERCLQEICATPQRYRRIEGEARRLLCEDFPFAIIYCDQPERGVIVAVMHLKRRPGYWRERLG